MKVLAALLLAGCWSARESVPSIPMRGETELRGVIKHQPRADPALTVAILGLEVVPPNPTTTQLASDLVDEMRAEALSARWPFVLSHNTNRQLADLMQIHACADPDPVCLDTIGRTLGVDRVIWGALDGSRYPTVRWRIALHEVGAGTTQAMNGGQAMRRLEAGAGTAIYQHLTGTHARRVTLAIVGPANGAKVYVDHQPAGVIERERAEVELPPGLHRVVVRPERGRSVIIDVQVDFTNVTTIELSRRAVPAHVR